LALSTTAGLLLAGCGGDDDASDDVSAGDPGGEAGQSETEVVAADEDAFPVTIEHAFGSTVIEEPPERVVTVGFTDHDSVLALGVQPVGVREWYGEQPNATFPWAQDALGGAEPEIVGEATISVEAVAALEPDLIIGIYDDLTDTYDTLSEIAPTIAQSGEYEQYGQPWQETTRMVGQALGRSDKAEELIGEVEDGFADARAEHPEFEGVTAAVAQFGEGSGTYFLLPPQDPKAAFMTQLGFEIPDEITEAIMDDESTELSFEQLDLVDQDVAVWLAGFESPELIAEVQDSSLYQSLDVVADERDLFLEAGVDELSWTTVLSLQAALDEVVPQLADLVEDSDG
jgi:iron complex transport system substrate-binding protein